MAAPRGTPGRTLFISDLHLDAERPAAVRQFERFLATVVPGADALYILGDLFEYWVGDDGLALPFPARMAHCIGEAAVKVPTHVMHGNRDFLVAERFASRTGTRLIDDPTVIDLYGRRALLMHGDTLCTGDAPYQAFRAKVRDPAWQRAMLSRPIEERIAVARGLRSESETAKVGKAEEIMDVSPEAVAAAFTEFDCDLLIHGHTHRPGRHVHRVGGRDRERWVLKDWYEAGGYLEAAPAGFCAVGDF